MADFTDWNIDKSKSLYNIPNWSLGYFDVNQKGNIVVRPNGKDSPEEIDLEELINSVKERGIELPVLFRFNGILRHRVQSMYEAFQDAIKKHNYTADYLPAYPIKVNQQRHVVDVLCQVGKDYSMGIEVGSKPELMAVLGLKVNKESLLLCNGYKDRSYIELALLAKKIGRRSIVIVEKFTELPLILEVAAELDVQPEIGFRLRLSGRGSGRWEKTGGDRAKFGLTISEILGCVKELEKNEQLDALSLIHFHVGSQLTNIASLRNALKESTQLYVQLAKRCPSLKYLDIGGGLGVDYDGSKTTFESSMNYTLEEYARDVVWTIGDICNSADVAHPNIVTESGRATVAHHSVLVFDVLGIANTFTNSCNPAEIAESAESQIVRDMALLLSELTAKNCQETLHDTLALRTDLLQQFNLGLVTIEDRALGDKCYWALLSKISEKSKELHYVPEDLEAIPAKLSDAYFCNLSVFQSLPDSWAIEQIFPITPVNRLNEEPNRPVVLADITCDSDGKIDRFADLRDVKHYLPAHKLKEGEPYYFAAFLLGAYQEILGDLHNLFGDTNAVHIDLDQSGQIEFSHVVIGDDISSVLKYVQYDREDLCENWRSALEDAVRSKEIKASELRTMYKKYSRAFEGYTYLTSSSNEL